MTESPRQPSPIPPGRLRLPPDRKPSDRKPAGQQAERTITGVVEAGVEARCLVMTDADGVQYLLLDGDPRVVCVGAHLTVVGRPTPGVITTCMQGLPFAIITAAPAG